MEDQRIINTLQRTVKYAMRLDLIEFVKDPQEKKAILSLEADFKRFVNKITKSYEPGIALRSYLLFVANRENYTSEEKFQIRKRLSEDMFKEVATWKNQ